MSNRFSSFIKKKLIGKNQNLVSLDEPFQVISYLLKDSSVTGIIDAGASNGRISKRLLRKFPKAHAYAFEPNPFYAESLRRYAEEDSRFHPYFLALSDREGSADLLITRSPGNTSLFNPGKALQKVDPEGSYVERKEKVQVITIDEWTRCHGDPAIELMKFDIQGGELKALRGATSTLQRSTLLVYTEIWFNCPYEGGALYSEIDLFFREHGFVLCDMFKPEYDKNNLITWANAIFLNAERFGI
jgi:FkbM family methyltransferase